MKYSWAWVIFRELPYPVLRGIYPLVYEGKYVVALYILATIAHLLASDWLFLNHFFLFLYLIQPQTQRTLIWWQPCIILVRVSLAVLVFKEDLLFLLIDFLSFLDGYPDEISWFLLPRNHIHGRSIIEPIYPNLAIIPVSHRGREFHWAIACYYIACVLIYCLGNQS